MRRPGSVTSLALVVLSFTGFYITRFVQALIQWDFLQSLPLLVPALYLALSGLVWAAVGLALAWALWTGRPWAPRAARYTVVIFGLYYWLDRLILAEPGAGRSNVFFRMAATLLILAFVFWSLSRPAAKDFFQGDRNRGAANHVGADE